MWHLWWVKWLHEDSLSPRLALGSGWRQADLPEGSRRQVINPALDCDDLDATLATAIEPTRLRLDRSKRLPHFTVQFVLSGSPVGHVVTVSSA